LVLLAAILLAEITTAAADAPFGIGFLWYPRSESAAARLTAESDFVDVILGGDKLKVFDQIRPPVRVVCISLALERHEQRPFPGVKETIELLRAKSIAPGHVIIGYNPERAPGTTAAELDNLLQSVQRAREMAQGFGSPLLVGPGLRDMLQREQLYPELAKLCDIWLIQSQRLQMDPVTRAARTPQEYRQGVERIVKLLRQGNPDIKVFVQLIASGSGKADRFTADEFVAYVRAVEDLVQAVRIYGGSPELLNGVIDRLRPEEGQP
jgi:hypothetical protein